MPGLARSRIRKRRKIEREREREKEKRGKFGLLSFTSQGFYKDKAKLAYNCVTHALCTSRLQRHHFLPWGLCSPVWVPRPRRGGRPSPWPWRCWKNPGTESIRCWEPCTVTAVQGYLQGWKHLPSPRAAVIRSRVAWNNYGLSKYDFCRVKSED